MKFFVNYINYSYLFSYILKNYHLLLIIIIISDLILIISNYYISFNIYHKKIFISNSENFYLFWHRSLLRWAPHHSRAKNERRPRHVPARSPACGHARSKTILRRSVYGRIRGTNPPDYFRNKGPFRECGSQV